MVRVNARNRVRKLPKDSVKTFVTETLRALFITSVKVSGKDSIRAGLRESDRD